MTIRRPTMCNIMTFCLAARQVEYWSPWIIHKNLQGDRHLVTATQILVGACLKVNWFSMNFQIFKHLHFGALHQRENKKHNFHAQETAKPARSSHCRGLTWFPQKIRTHVGYQTGRGVVFQGVFWLFSLCNKSLSRIWLPFPIPTLMMLKSRQKRVGERLFGFRHVSAKFKEIFLLIWGRVYLNSHRGNWRVRVTTSPKKFHSPHPKKLGLTSSTAQGGGGSFKNRKRIGEIDCCEWRMSEQKHWPTD